MYIFQTTVQKNALMALFTAATFYGLYVVTLIHCIRWLVYTDDGWKQRNQFNRLMLLATIVIFVCSTMNIVLALPFQIWIMDADKWVFGEQVISVCKSYHGWHLEQKND